jgi:cytidylate kinase
MIIVIDGPAGSGKSSTARQVANQLGLQYLDSGALYRAVTVAWLASEKDVQFFDRLNFLKLTFRYENGLFRVWVNNEDVTQQIRTEKVSSNVSEVASRPDVRAFVNSKMHEAISESICIADGRDLGTVVFPDAELKIFMDASADVRARRRTEELIASGVKANSDDVLKAILKRDELDSNREADPLRMADDAIRIQTDDLTFDEQVDLICNMIQEKGQS